MWVVHTLVAPRRGKLSRLLGSILPVHLLRPINFAPRGKLRLPGAKLSPRGEFYPLGVALSPGGEIICSPLHSSKQLRVFTTGGEHRGEHSS
jgi:hypothetical protein